MILDEIEADAAGDVSSAAELSRPLEDLLLLAFGESVVDLHRRRRVAGEQRQLPV